MEKKTEPHFFKPLVADYSTQLMIPPEFVKQFGVQPHKTKIVGPCKVFWEVSIEKVKHDLFFKEGWTAFVRDHDLKSKDLLVFKYAPGTGISSSHFSVMVFGKNAVEKEFSIIEPTKSVMVKNPVSLEKDNEHKKKSRNGAKDPKEAADKYMSESKYPGFVAVMSLSNLKRRLLIVPVRFGNRQFKKQNKNRVKLVVAGSRWRSWSVTLVNYHPKRVSGRIYGGWGEFADSNGLKEGDVCVFELVKKSQNAVMKVSIFRN